MNHVTEVVTAVTVSNVFVMIGAEPNSGWLFGTVTLDKKGFILTGDRLDLKTHLIPQACEACLLLVMFVHSP